MKEIFSHMPHILDKSPEKMYNIPSLTADGKTVSAAVNPKKGDFFMTYQEALAWLHGMPRLHKEPTLSRIRSLLSLLGDPQKTLAGRFLHVTGTNGKGSCCAFLTNALRCAGYRVGRFISPFIMEFRERMEIGGVPISEEEVSALTEELRDAAARYEAENGELPLEFELVTAMGLLWFARRSCDLVVLEVGIGGMYDPTNVVEPLLSVIMRVDYDHTEILGPTLADIAAQKAGIIKKGRPCIVYPENPEQMLNVIQEKCKTVHAPMLIPDIRAAKITSARPGSLTFTYRGRTYVLRLSGLYQLRNALCAIEALMLLPELGFSVSEEDIVRGLSETTFPARFEVLSEHPTVILDGAHNQSGMEALREALDFYFPDQPFLCLCGMLRDKTPEEALAPMLLPGRARYAACITPPSPRAMDASALAEIFRKNGIPADGYPSPGEALNALKKRNEEGILPLLCFGSLYSAGDIRRLYDLHTEN